MKLPPFGERFQPVPPSGVRVVVGAGSWAYQESQRVPIMVLPEEGAAKGYDWPVSPDKCALIVETGPANDRQLDAVADALVQAGHRFVVAVRHSEYGKNEEPYIYYEAEYV